MEHQECPKMPQDAESGDYPIEVKDGQPTILTRVTLKLWRVKHVERISVATGIGDCEVRRLAYQKNSGNGQVTAIR